MSTETTNKKIKIDNGTTFGRTYTDKAVDELLKNIGGGGSGGSSILRKDGTYFSGEDDAILNSISFSKEELDKIKNGEINIIYGEFALDVSKSSYYYIYFSGIVSGNYVYSLNTTNNENNITSIVSFQLIINNESCTLVRYTTNYPSTPSLPTDASSKTYTLKAVNGVLTWVE